MPGRAPPSCSQLWSSCRWEWHVCWGLLSMDLRARKSSRGWLSSWFSEAWLSLLSSSMGTGTVSSVVLRTRAEEHDRTAYAFRCR